MARTKHLQNRAYRLLVARLVAARKKANLSQVQVAKRIGQSQSFVSKCEGLYRRIDILELLAFLNVYGITPNQFYARMSDRIAR